MKRYFIIALLLSGITVFTSAEEHPFTVATYNIDGLPETILGITVNDDGPRADCTTKIAQKLLEKDWDIVGLNEDFDYHKRLVLVLSDEYQFGKWRGEVDAWEAIKNDGCVPSDGLGIICKKDITLANEKWTKWCTYNGYLDCENDGMAEKGFRHYTITMPWGMAMSMYILHADAGDDSGDVKARMLQFTQLANAIIAEDPGMPIIVMGDYNCWYCFDELKSYFIDVLNNQEHFTATDAMIELCNDGVYPECVHKADTTLLVNQESWDHIIYINDDRSLWQLEANEFAKILTFTRDDGVTQLSDHYPSYARLTAVNNSSATMDIEADKADDKVVKYIQDGTLMIRRNGVLYNVNGMRYK